MRRLLALSSVALAACGGGTDPVPNSVTEATVKARFGAWVKAWNWHSPDSLAPFYVHKEHLTVVWPNGEETRGWAAESAFQKSFLPTVTVTSLVPQNPRVLLVRKNLALVSFPFTLDMFAGDARQIGQGRGVMLWQKEGGTWKIYASQLSYTKAVEARVSARPPR